MRRTSEGRWLVCQAGHLHQGSHGGVGLLLRSVSDHGEEPRFLLAERCGWTDARKTWGALGGPLKEAENLRRAARRTAEEKIGAVPRYVVTDTEVQDCGGGWPFYIVCADVAQPFAARSAGQRLATGWFTLEEARALPLIRGFRRWIDERAR